MKGWISTYPHDIYASVLLLDGKIEGWKVGERFWSSPVEAKTYWKMDRLQDYKSEYVKFVANSPEEHDQIFNEQAREWYKKWSLADDYRLNPPY